MVLLCNAVALGKKKGNENIGRGPRAVSLCATGRPFPLFTCAISSFFAPKPHGNACYAGYGGPREQCRSVPRGGVEKERIGRGPRERCRSVPQGGVKKKKERERQRDIGRGPREHYRSVPRGGVKKEKKGKKNDRSWTEREIYRYPSIRYK